MKLFRRPDAPGDDERRDTPARPALHLVPDAAAAEQPEGFVQRRDEVRTRVALPMQLQDVYGRWVEKLTLDLSAGGVLLADTRDVFPGGNVAFSLDLRPDGPLVEGRAEVLRVTDEGQCAMRFLDLDLLTRDDIARYVFACERARVKTRDGSGR